jgi:DMSO/TMAO reductase YedYZ heme-binding membrane subunit
VGIGVGLFLIALGAILSFALGDDTFGSLNLDTVGIILMIVGAIGLLLSLLFWSSVAPFRRDVGTERTVVRDREVP